MELPQCCMNTFGNGLLLNICHNKDQSNIIKGNVSNHVLKAGSQIYFERSITCTHYIDIIRSAMASQITGVPTVCSNVCSCTDQRKHQSSVSVAFVKGIHLWPVDSPQKGPVTWKMSPFYDHVPCFWLGNFKYLDICTHRHDQDLMTTSSTAAHE